MHFKIRIIVIYSVILRICHLPTSQGSRGCNRLEENLTLNNTQKQQLDLKQCGRIHEIDAAGHISGSRQDVKRFRITEVPWSAALWLWNATTGESTHHCGGSIIRDKYILTAAHCLDHQILANVSDAKSLKSDLTVIVGMENPGENCTHKKDVEYKIEDFFIHPEFNFPYFDVAVIELRTKIEFTRGIATICLSSTSTDVLQDDAVSLSGWGATEPEGPPSKVLRGTRNLVVTSDLFCKYRIGDFTYSDPLYASVFNRTSWLKTNIYNKEKSTEGLLCVRDQKPDGSIGSCGGDSGSAVVKAVGAIRLTYEQVGIVSGGRCSDRSTPSVLTHIGHKRVLEFISNITTTKSEKEGYGTSMCCSRIRVTLNGVVKDKWSIFVGTYQKASELINNRSYWNDIDGDGALWWNNMFNVWIIGISSDLGSSTGGLSSAQDSACPTSDNQYIYHDGDGIVLAPINSVSIQCV